jgi:hypothetical protein
MQPRVQVKKGAVALALQLRLLGSLEARQNARTAAGDQRSASEIAHASGLQSERSMLAL